MGITSESSSYGVKPGVVFSYPVTCANGDWSIVEDLPIDDFSQSKLDATEAELFEERSAVEDLL